MIIIMLILLLVIGLLANVVIGAATYHRQCEKEDDEMKKGLSTTAAIVSVTAMLLFSFPLFAQDTKPVAAPALASNQYEGLSPVAFYCIVGVLATEVLVIFVLLYQLRLFLAKEKLRVAFGAKRVKLSRRFSWWDKMNSFRPAAQEADLDLGHEYDGIRELNNRLPRWWIYGFYFTILFAGVYLWRYHVSHTAPLSGEEYQIAMREAEVQKADYLKRSANNIDENTVKLLTDADDIGNGQQVFAKNCSPCHGKAAEGIVGPNLTDDYWLHGGGIKDIFKTIKYGWPEKGMKSWKDDLSPSQIAQVASFIKSLHGTNPPNAKEKQGELFQEDSPVKQADSLKIVASLPSGKATGKN